MKTSKTMRTFQYIFAILIIFCTLGPFLWLIISSVSYQKDLTQVPLHWIPDDITFQRYFDVFFNSSNQQAYTFRIAMMNSFIISGSVTLISLFVGGIAAYSFARLRFKFRQSLIYIFLFTYMIPPIVIVIPMYMLFSNLHLLDTKWTLILLDLTFIIPFVIWIMQSYFGSFSKSFEEAASMDGCNRLQTLWYVIMPIVRPGIIATGIFSFLLAWEEFFYALIFTSSIHAKTISVAISEFGGKNAVDYGMIATGGVLACIPPVLIAVIFQKYLVKGMTAGGVKE